MQLSIHKESEPKGPGFRVALEGGEAMMLRDFSAWSGWFGQVTDDCVPPAWRMVKGYSQDGCATGCLPILAVLVASKISWRDAVLCVLMRNVP